MTCHVTWQDNPLRVTGIDHIFTVEKGENGQKKNRSYGPLYRIIRDKLLILWKTLNESLNKGFICVSNSLKKEGGFRFYINYQGLNNIIKKDRYPLPLIKETLSGISKVRCFIKLDITVAFYKIRIAKG